MGAVIGVAEDAIATLQDESDAERPMASSLELTPVTLHTPAASGLTPPPQHLRLHPALCLPALRFFIGAAPGLEARCRTAALNVPDGSVLPGLPGSVRSEYTAMALALRSLPSTATQALQCFLDSITDFGSSDGSASSARCGAVEDVNAVADDDSTALWRGPAPERSAAAQSEVRPRSSYAE